MSPNRFTQSAHKKYLNLETCRKTGVPVATPVWFAEEHGTFYLDSLAHAGKVKRIRNNPKVRIVPCDARGHPTGEWVTAQARILDAQGAARGHQLLNQKYGWLKRIGDAFSRLRRRERGVSANRLHGCETVASATFRFLPEDMARRMSPGGSDVAPRHRAPRGAARRPSPARERLHSTPNDDMICAGPASAPGYGRHGG